MLLGGHPHAAEQPTASSRTLIETEGWMGRVYFGYGDLEEDTGPIRITAYDPATRTWDDRASFDTEQIG